MKKLLLFSVIILSLNAGCSLKVVPVPVESGIINQKDSSQTVTKENLSITINSAETQLTTYNLDRPVASFYVSVVNQTDREFAVAPGQFVLLDDENNQYLPLTPEMVKEMISRDSYYLIPYPYVGFYYLEDYEKSSFYNTFTSDLPYYYEVYPQDLFTKALPASTVIPKAKVGGLLYFKIDLAGKKGVKLLVYKNGTAKSSPPDFSFPFKIEK